MMMTRIDCPAAQHGRGPNTMRSHAMQPQTLAAIRAAIATRSAGCTDLQRPPQHHCDGHLVPDVVVTRVKIARWPWPQQLIGATWSWSWSWLCDAFVAAAAAAEHLHNADDDDNDNDKDDDAGDDNSDADNRTTIDGNNNATHGMSVQTRPRKSAMDTCSFRDSRLRRPWNHGSFRSTSFSPNLHDAHKKAHTGTHARMECRTHTHARTQAVARVRRTPQQTRHARLLLDSGFKQHRRHVIAHGSVTEPREQHRTHP
jgi:hypothetical protein